jgi:hypothetical protein
MNKPQIEFVKTKGLTINLPSISTSMTIRTESDEVVILMRLTLRPRDNVVDVNLDISASGDCTAVSSLDEHATADVSRYWRTVVHNQSPNFKQCIPQAAASKRGFGRGVVRRAAGYTAVELNR